MFFIKSEWKSPVLSSAGKPALLIRAVKLHPPKQNCLPKQLKYIDLKANYFLLLYCYCNIYKRLGGIYPQPGPDAIVLSFLPSFILGGIQGFEEHC